MTIIEKILSFAFFFSVVANCFFFYYWRKEYLRNEPLTAKVYDFFRWIAVILIFLIPTSEAFLKKAGIDLILISDNTMEIFKQTLIYFVLPHMLYSIKDFIPAATEFLRVLKSNSSPTNLIQNSSFQSQNVNPLSPVSAPNNADTGIFSEPNPAQYH